MDISTTSSVTRSSKANVSIIQGQEIITRANIRSGIHSLIRGVLLQSCSAGAKHFTKNVFCHPQFSGGVNQNIENCCAILTLFGYVDYYQNNQFYIVKIYFSKFCFIGTMIFGTLAWTIELYMTKYIIGEIFSSGGAILHKNPSDQIVGCDQMWHCSLTIVNHFQYIKRTQQKESGKIWQCPSRGSIRLVKTL